jgi:hypothetical protein
VNKCISIAAYNKAFCFKDKPRRVPRLVRELSVKAFSLRVVYIPISSALAHLEEM